ncbi:hypothetical protein L6164_003385 [Bauhinia variegata]|uniref:Uncharacterized protein n=1 Tax=Bauhinia variegata TaxID=167791 RepID=A0ACB9Q173_BAUVA|nr:hypothetical protein L6164_003385 [Bauhinia variegata]
MEEAPTYAPSIPVPNVQEMVKKEPWQVPQRYVRSQEEMDKVIDMSHLSSEIPVIDLSLLSCGNKEELLKLDVACKDWGFFQLVNYGVPKEVLQRMKSSATEFFELPIEEKNKFSMPSNDIQGYGHANVVSEDQTLDWSDALIEIIEAYSSEVKRVGEELLSSLSMIMGMQKHALLEVHKELVQVLRVNYYPPCSSPDQVLGLSPHSDTSTISILMQDDDVSGLEIRHRGGWVPVTPISDALVVNVGDVIEMWSNGKYKSIEHKVVTNKNKGRFSHASFLFPHDDVEVEPLDLMVDDQRREMYRRVRYGDFLRQSMNMKINGKAHVNVVKIN